MAGAVRGSDYNSWWQNRAEYRREASQALDRWRAAASRFSQGAGGARASAPPDAAIALETLVQQGDGAIATMENAKTQLGALDYDRQQAQDAFASTQQSVQAAFQRRVHAEQEQAHKKAYDSAVRKQGGTRMIRKLAAVAIFVAVIYVIVQY